MTGLTSEGHTVQILPMTQLLQVLIIIEKTFTKIKYFRCNNIYDATHIDDNKIIIFITNSDRTSCTYVYDCNVSNTTWTLVVLLEF